MADMKWQQVDPATKTCEHRASDRTICGHEAHGRYDLSTGRNSNERWLCYMHAFARGLHRTRGTAASVFVQVPA
jgi:hypothetical protein